MKIANTVCKYCFSSGGRKEGESLTWHACGTLELNRLNIWRQSERCKKELEEKFTAAAASAKDVN